MYKNRTRKPAEIVLRSREREQERMIEGLNLIETH
jgi:hypothetical protein